MNEAVEAAYQLEDRVGIQLGPGHRERLYCPPTGAGRPPAEAAADGRGDPDPTTAGRPRRRPRFRLQPLRAPGRPVERAGRELPLPQLRLPAASSAADHRPGRARTAWPARWPTGVGGLAAASGDRADVSRGRRRGTEPAELPARLAGAAADRGVLRLGRRGQDHGVGRLRPGGRPARAGGPASSRSTRPGAWPTPSASTPWPTPPPPIAGRLAGRALGPHARPQGHLRRPGRPLRPHARAGRGHPGQPPLPEPDRRPVGHPGVHGHGEALRADRERRLRPGRGGHPAHPQRPRLPRRPAPAHPVPREPPLPGPAHADPGLPAGRAVATQALLRTISKVAGAEIVHDAVAFFQAFAGHGGGLPASGPTHMRRLLARPTTAFVLVTSPRPDTVEEAGWFADKLNETGLAVDGLVVNRVHPALRPRRPTLPTAPAGQRPGRARRRTCAATRP